jgi:hypothetical protein
MKGQTFRRGPVRSPGGDAGVGGPHSPPGSAPVPTAGRTRPVNANSSAPSSVAIADVQKKGP